MGISGYVPFFNNAPTVLAAVDSLRRQDPPLEEVFAVDDGSTDSGPDLLEAAGVRVIRSGSNRGRGSARHRAMQEAQHPFVLCCDATNTLPPDFARRALLWFQDSSVAAVFGLITDPAPRGVTGRWRARHLFKSHVSRTISRRALLITFGTMVRAEAVAAVGGYNHQLRHSEDSDLGQRLLDAGYDIVADPDLPIHCNTSNSLSQVLERYWRWYVGKEEHFTFQAYCKSVWFAARVMAREDLRFGDPQAALVSLLAPHYQLCRFLQRKKN
jgi:GT2 family glycosyltransferase